jgi:hypothetical protein
MTLVQANGPLYSFFESQPEAKGYGTRPQARRQRMCGACLLQGRKADSWVKHTRFPYIIQLCCQTLPTSYLALIHLTVGGATGASDAYSKCLRYEVVPSILYYLHITLPIYMYNELFPMKRIESFSFKGLPTVLHLLASKLQAPRTVSLHNTKINYFYF